MKTRHFPLPLACCLGLGASLNPSLSEAQETQTSTPAVAAPPAVTPSEAAADPAPPEPAADWGDFAASVAAAETPVFEARFYGYIDTHFEQVADTPASIDPMGNTVYEENAYEWDVFNLHAMVQGTIMGRYRFFLNLASPGSGGIEDEPLVVRNAWVEAPIYQTYLQLRAGKTYRRFGLYNEILDAVPTFIGIETPELFDKDHLMLTRTTNFMLHGVANFDDVALNYSLATGTDERAIHSVPLGADLHVTWGSLLKLGTSFYWSGGDALPTRGVGDGSPKGGVNNWMERDRYVVFGGYGQLDWEGLIVQLEYWQAQHDAIRDVDSTLALIDADLNRRQRERFFVGGDPANGVNTDADFTVRTFYTRIGYDIKVGESSSVIPYVQLDYYSNPETINDKDFGGDAEAGLTEDGEFYKFTVGTVLRPIAPVALKIDGSAHLQKFNGQTVLYPEIRLSLSYLWELGGI